MGCLSLSEPSFRPLAWAHARLADVADKLPASPVAEPAPALEPEEAATLAPPKPKQKPVVVRLPAVKRARPATHGGGRDALLPAWELPREEVDVLPPLPSVDASQQEDEERAAPLFSSPSRRQPDRSSASAAPVSVALPQQSRLTAGAFAPAVLPAPPSRPDAPSEPESPVYEDMPAAAPKTPAKQRIWTSTAGMGCQRAYDEFEQTIDVSAKSSAADVQPGAYAALLEDFDRYRGCDLDHEMDVSICVAVVNGRAKGVTVKTQPANARLAACISSAVQRTRFPKSPRMDLVRTELIVR